MSTRTFIGLAVGSALDGLDAALVRVAGIGLHLAARVENAVRVPFPPMLRDAILRKGPDLTRQVADTAAQAIRSAAKSERAPRDLFAIGLLEPHRTPSLDWLELADHLADQTGLTIVHGFRGRDRTGGGAGHPITAAADYLLFRNAAEERLLIHLGSVASVIALPAKSERISDVQGFDAGPCLSLLNALLAAGTGGREWSDPGGKRAVQGCCREELLARWSEHPFFDRKPPRAVAAEAFGSTFVTASLEAARALAASLPDVLCTATHLIAHAIGESVKRWLPPAQRRIVLSGDGVKNGFLWQRISQEFQGAELTRLDDIGVPVLGRNAAAAAILAALLLDGVPGNLPLLTGATAARLSGHFSPGDMRNWSRVASWAAEQGGAERLTRAA